MNRNAIIATLLFALIAIPLGAQTPRDSVHAFRQKPRIDSVSVALDAYHRWCNATYTSPKYLKALCPIVKQRPDLRLKPVEDSLLLAPPIVQPPPGPNAAFTFSCANGTITLDGRSSTGRIVSYLWHASVTGRPDKSDAVTQRGWGSTDLPYQETLTVTDSAGLTSAVTQTVSCATTTPPPIDSTTPPPTQPPSSGTIAAPWLPKTVPPSADPYPGRACASTVPGGGSITAFLQAARGGSVVCTSAGVQFPPYQYPARVLGDTGWIVLRTATTLPPEGTRMRPSLSPNLSKIVVTSNGVPAVTTTPGTWGYYTRGIEITTASTVTQTGNLVELGTSGPSQDTMAEVPQSFVFAQVYVHGTPTLPLKRCILLQSGATAIVDSWISECHLKGQEGHGVGGWNGPGPHLIRNNYIDGAGINLMWGGATPDIPNMVAADITIIGNHVMKPIAWKGVWTVKNLLETKNAVRVLVDRNVFDGSWSDAQIGPALLFKSSNDQATCNWCRTTDVTVRNAYITHSSGGIVINGRENYNGGSVDSVAKRFLFQDVVLDSLNQPPYTGGARGIQIGSGASDIVFERTVLHGPQDDGNTMVLDNLNPSPRTAFRSSVWKHGYYFASGDGVGMGLPAMTAALPGFQWTSMTVVRGQQLNPLPAGTTVVTSESQAVLAAQIRATVTAAVAGVIVPP